MSTTTTAFQDAIDAVRDFPTGLIIDGEQVDSTTSGATLENINPATEEVLATVSVAGPEDVDRAVGAARAAFETTWRAVPGRERGRLLFRLAELVERDAARFHAIKLLENGTPAGGPDVPMSIEVFRYFGGWADKIHGTVIPTPGAIDPAAAEGSRPALRPTHAYATREPVGVVAAIISWNAPLLTTAIKLAPALAAGCTVVVKTSERSMQAVLHLVALIQEAGFPPGVVNVLNGAGDVGKLLGEHPGVDHVSFTGSPENGRLVAQGAAKTLKRVTLELGGKNPQLIFADADLDQACAGAALAVLANQGQVCLSGSRILVHERVYDEVVDRIARVAQSVVVGDPFAPETQMGALISADHMERVLGYVEAGRTDGARLIAGGARVDRPGYFVQPTFFADAHNDMRIAREEIFGPVGTIIPFATDDEAIAIANDTPFGLGATVWTSDLSRAFRTADAIRAGAVSVNAWSPLDAAVPHGGFKQSGLGRESGWAAIADLTEEKVVTVVY
ncbi:aldehyde dehydrogenase family protein [Patulibacter sp. NPDC049589]|uniref:aldehyde dehydrogenase family protein n=1 Tax=Patulibacter sp. NPDC049589 TaxID=3154731 RepID=UPI0034300F8A